MNTRLIVLELVLRELGMEPVIDSLQDRIRLQKAIYLSQEAGVPLGYRFGWYVRGPYSKGLARDYYYLRWPLVTGQKLMARTCARTLSLHSPKSSLS